MPEPQQNDWFSQNAPPPPGAQDWFSQNAPPITTEQMNTPAAAAGVKNPGVSTPPLQRSMNYRGFKEKVLQPAENLAVNAIPAAGMVAGGMAGSVEPGGGNVLGATLGGMGGESLKRAIQRKPLNKEAAVDIGKAGLQGAESEMGGQIIGKGLELGAGALSRALPASTKAAAGLFERGVAPGGLSAEDQALMRENFSRAAKYIAPETRGFPVAGGEGGAMRGAATAHRAADNLWKGAVEPVTELFKDVQRPGDDIASAIRSGFTELDRTTKPAAVNAGNDLAKFFEGRPVSVGEMAEYIKQLNNDRAVTRFYNMSPNEQVQAELADPSLRSKVTALHALREKMFDAIGESGGDRLGKQFAEARKDWGALRSIEDQVRGAKVPTPAPLWTRIGSTVRGAISPHGADFWMRPQETVFGINNPNRLITKSFNMLGRTDLRPPSLDVAPQFARGLLGERTATLTPQEPEIGANAPNAPQEYPGRFGTQAIVPHPNPAFRHNPPTGPNEPPIDVEHFDRWEPGLSPNNPLPSSGRTIITPRPGVEWLGGPRELPLGTPPAQPERESIGGAIGPKKPLAPTPEPEPVDLGSATEGPKKAREPRPREPREQLQSFDPETLETAKQELAEANDKWQTFERPGRYHLDLNAGEREATIKGANYIYGVPSARPNMEDAHPWLKNLPKMTSGKLRAAVESGKGVEYTRLLNEAGRHIQGVKDANAPVIDEFRGQFESAAQRIEGVAPELAQTLRDLAAGKYSAMRGLSSFVRDTLHEAASAEAFDKAVADAAAEGSSDNVQELGPEGTESRQPNSQASELGREPILPGMERAVAENKQAAAVEQGRKLTEKINEPQSIESAAGLMEQRSPLFRGTEASPQREIFGNQATPSAMKRPWEMTRDEYAQENWQGELQRFRDRPDILDAKDRDEEIAHFKQLHLNEVAKAIKEGKPVPPRVLADYPKLAR